MAALTFKAMGPRVSEGEREMDGDGNAVSSRSHLVEIEKGERQGTEVAAPVIE